MQRSPDEIKAYHHTTNDFRKFVKAGDPSPGREYAIHNKHNGEHHFYGSPEDFTWKNSYGHHRIIEPKSRILPTWINTKNFHHVDWKGGWYNPASEDGAAPGEVTIAALGAEHAAREAGYHGIVHHNIRTDGPHNRLSKHIISWTPGTVRSALSDHEWY